MIGRLRAGLLVALGLLPASRARADTTVALGLELITDLGAADEAYERGTFPAVLLAVTFGLGARTAIEVSAGYSEEIFMDFGVAGRFHLGGVERSSERRFVSPYLFGRLGVLGHADHDCATSCGTALAGDVFQLMSTAGGGVELRHGKLDAAFDAGVSLRTDLGNGSYPLYPALVLRFMVGFAF